MELQIESTIVKLREEYICDFEYLQALSTTTLYVEDVIIIPVQLKSENSLLTFITYIQKDYKDQKEEIEIELSILNYIDDIENLGQFLCWKYLDDFMIDTLRIAKKHDQKLLSLYDSKIDLVNQYTKTLSKLSNIQKYKSATKISPYISIHTDKFKDDINRLIGFELVYTPDMAIAGGLIAGLMNPSVFSNCSDVDIWLLNSKNPNETIQTILQNIKGKYVSILDESVLRIFIEDNNITINSIQIIHTQYETIEEILQNFDLDICKMAVCHNRLCLYYDGVRQIKQKVINIHYFFKHKVNRIIKYMKRGFYPIVFGNNFQLIPCCQESLNKNKLELHQTERTVQNFLDWICLVRPPIRRNNRRGTFIIKHNMVVDCTSITQMDINPNFSQYQNDNNYYDNNEYDEQCTETRWCKCYHCMGVIKIVQSGKFHMTNTHLYIDDICIPKCKYIKGNLDLPSQLTIENAMVFTKALNGKCRYFEVFHIVNSSLADYDELYNSFVCVDLTKNVEYGFPPEVLD